MVFCACRGSFELGGRWREGVTDAEPPPKGVGRSGDCSFDVCVCISNMLRSHTCIGA